MRLLNQLFFALCASLGVLCKHQRTPNISVAKLEQALDQSLWSAVHPMCDDKFGEGWGFRATRKARSKGTRARREQGEQHHLGTQTQTGAQKTNTTSHLSDVDLELDPHHLVLLRQLHRLLLAAKHHLSTLSHRTRQMRRGREGVAP
eukprot:1863622-Rhodomonas_salina.1